jgi:hypothetical protein
VSLVPAGVEVIGQFPHGSDAVLQEEVADSTGPSVGGVMTAAGLCRSKDLAKSGNEARPLLRHERGPRAEEPVTETVCTLALDLAVPVAKVAYMVGGNGAARDVFVVMEPENWPNVLIGQVLTELLRCGHRSGDGREPQRARPPGC